MTDITIAPLEPAAFAPFGEVLALAERPTMRINRGRCGRHHDLAALDFGDGAAGISLFDGTPYGLPLTVELVERHPLGSQAFLPMSGDPFLVIVAPDEGGRPGLPLAFVTDGRQGVNYRRGVWHGVLTPIVRRATFAVVDRIGDGDNLEEYPFETPPRIVDADGAAARAVRAARPDTREQTP